MNKEKAKLAKGAKQTDIISENSDEGNINLDEALKKARKRKEEEIKTLNNNNNEVNDRDNENIFWLNKRTRPPIEKANENVEWLQKYAEDSKNYFFQKEEEIDHESKEFYDFLYHSKTFKP